LLVKSKSEDSTRPLKNVENFSSWTLPKLSKTNVPGFEQPLDNVEQEVEVKLTEEEIAKIKADELKAIKDAAYQEGLTLGKNEGLKAANEKIEQESMILNQLLTDLAEPLKLCEEKTQQQLLQLSFAIARQIVRRELQQDPSQLIAIIRDALKFLPIGIQRVNIALNPEDAQMIKDKLLLNSRLQESDKDDESRWQINQDPALERGSCLVTTNNSTIDVSIDKQVAILFSRIAGGLRSNEVVQSKSKGVIKDIESDIKENDTSGFEKSQSNTAQIGTSQNITSDDLSEQNGNQENTVVDKGEIQNGTEQSRTEQNETTESGQAQNGISDNGSGRTSRNGTSQNRESQNSKPETPEQEQEEKLNESQTIKIQSTKTPKTPPESNNE
jgi:flagellar assembly protein FliH